jgi:hypothetical protein
VIADPEDLARRSLRWDAAYFALAGALSVSFAAPLGDHLGIPAWLAAITGFGILTWAVLVWGFARSDEWWGPSALVAGANLVAFTGLAMWAAATSGPGGAVLGLAAAQVLALGLLQVVTLVLGWDRRVPQGTTRRWP